MTYRITICIYDREGLSAGLVTETTERDTLEKAKDRSRDIWKTLSPGWKQIFITDANSTKTLFYADNFKLVRNQPTV